MYLQITSYVVVPDDDNMCCASVVLLITCLSSSTFSEGRKEQDEIKPGTLRECGNSRCCIPCSFTNHLGLSSTPY